jgi:hypothetical protein
MSLLARYFASSTNACHRHLLLASGSRRTTLASCRSALPKWPTVIQSQMIIHLPPPVFTVPGHSRDFHAPGARCVRRRTSPPYVCRLAAPAGRGVSLCCAVVPRCPEHHIGDHPNDANLASRAIDTCDQRPLLCYSGLSAPGRARCGWMEGFSCCMCLRHRPGLALHY